MDQPIPTVRIVALAHQQVRGVLLEPGSEAEAPEDLAIRREHQGALRILGELSPRGRKYHIALDTLGGLQHAQRLAY
jgi:hypothetical protein